MSDLNPKGALVVIDGEERHLLFTLNVIDEIQSTRNKTVFDVLQDMLDPIKQPGTVRYLLGVLLRDEVGRERYRNPESNIKKLSDEEVGYAITNFDMASMVTAILEAYGVSMPKSDEESEAPKAKSRRTNN